MFLTYNDPLFIYELAQNKQAPKQLLLLLDIFEATLCCPSRGLVPTTLAMAV